MGERQFYPLSGVKSKPAALGDGFLFSNRKPGPLGQVRNRGLAIKIKIKYLTEGLRLVPLRGQQAKSRPLWGRILYFIKMLKNVSKFMICVVVAVTFASCAGTASRKLKTNKEDMLSKWRQVYVNAINDALNPEPGEIVYDLTSIVKKENNGLQWKTINNDSYVLMVSLKANVSDLKDYIGSTEPFNTGSHDVWVTASPELQNLCQNPNFFSSSNGNLDMRLRQILGLTPTAEIRYFVEYWVKPENLFRPAPDNEITDNTAGLCLPSDTEQWYRTWFNELRSHQYYQCNPPDTDPEKVPTSNDAYPWTQLGYTYDWGNPEFPHKGLSEFIIAQGSLVYINKVKLIDKYCNSN